MCALFPRFSRFSLHGAPIPILFQAHTASRRVAPGSDDEGPDLTPWDQAFAKRVQPIFSALFHDVNTPLAVLDSNLFLAQRHAEMLAKKLELDEEATDHLQAIIQSIAMAKAAGKRVQAGLQVPRDAIWKTLKEGVPFPVQEVIDGIAKATKSPPKEK